MTGNVTRRTLVKGSLAVAAIAAVGTAETAAVSAASTKAPLLITILTNQNPIVIGPDGSDFPVYADISTFFQGQRYTNRVVFVAPWGNSTSALNSALIDGATAAMISYLATNAGISASAADFAPQLLGGFA